MKIPFLELRRESQHFAREIQEAVKRVTQRGWYILGPELEALEKEFASFLSIPYAIGVASGTDALTLALEGTEAVRPGEKHEVITSALSAAFTALAIVQAGAIPRFADIDPSTLQVDPAQLESLIGKHTRALLPVHLYGHSCDMHRIGEAARERRLTIIEDACQAHGARQDGRFLGTLGQASGFSFYPTKNLGALGDAGMVATWDEDVFIRIKKLRNGGQSRSYCHELLGRNSRLDELQAAILRFKLQCLEDRNEARRVFAGRYDEAFAGLDLKILPATAGLVPNRHLYPIRTSRREELRHHLMQRGIETLVHYPVPLPHQPAFRQFVLPGQRFPAAEAVTREILSLPLHPELAEHEIDYIIQSVREFF